MRFNLATIQLSLTEYVELNYNKLAQFLDELEEGSLVLLPEMFFCGFDYDKLEEHALLSEYIIEKLKLTSKEKNLLICGTVPEKTQEGIKNSAVLIENGKIIGKRSKVKLFSPFEEDKHFVAGKGNPVFETRFGRVGILICFELRFTDMVLELKKKKIDVLLVPAQWGYSRREHLRILSQARAIELQSYVVVADTWGKFKDTEFAGQSGIYSPWGEVLEFSEKGDIYLEAVADLSYVKMVRNTIPVEVR
ncbi:carbon-nitrogen hydrolase family protein [Hydrogenivirga sp.]